MLPLSLHCLTLPVRVYTENVVYPMVLQQKKRAILYFKIQKRSHYSVQLARYLPLFP